MADSKTIEVAVVSEGQAEPLNPWRCGEPWKHPVPKPKQHWKKCHDLVRKYDEEMCDAWREEVDKLLIFAGLFSATVTAFTIESYKWLQEDSDEATSRILAHISLQLSQGLANATAPVPGNTPFEVQNYAIRINICWFLSLTLSMATVLIGILCLQWLRVFQGDAARSHKDAVSLRQMRSEGLRAWKVPQILSALPLLLQSALVLFFVGVLELLWAYNQVVASVVTVAVGILFLFILATTVLPALQPIFVTDPHLRVNQCPYKSPQSWVFYRFTVFFAVLARYLYARWVDLKETFKDKKPPDIPLKESVSDETSLFAYFGRFSGDQFDSSWKDYDIRWRYLRDATFFDDETGYPCEPQDSADILHALTWIDKAFTHDLDAVYTVYHCLLELGGPQAVHVVSGLDPGLSYLPGLLFPEPGQVDTVSQSSSDFQRSEHVLAVFLWLHKYIHPSLNVFYLESVIRLINTSGECVPFIALRQSADDLNGLTGDMLKQLFDSLKTAVSHGDITIQHGSQIWGFLRDLFQLDPSPNEEFLAVVFDIFEEFHHWLTQSEETSVYRVEVCVTGITWIFSLLDAQKVTTFRDLDSFQKLEELVKALDGYVSEYQEFSRVLRGLNKRRWPDLKRKMLHDVKPSTSPPVDTTTSNDENKPRFEEA